MINDIDSTVGDDFVVVDNSGTVQVLESSVDADTSNDISNNNDLIAPSFGKDVSVPIVPSPIAPSPIAPSSGKDVADLHVT
jgi:hypothetical protein